MLNRNNTLKLANYVLKRYEQSDSLYYFYNAKSDKCWKCDETIGSVIEVLNGTLCFTEIVEILAENNPETAKQEIADILEYAFTFLLEEEFIVYSN